QAEDGIRDRNVTGVQTCALPILDAGAPRKVRVIFNPSSGSKVGVTISQATPEQLRALMDRYGLGEELVVAGSEAEMRDAAREAEIGRASCRERVESGVVGGGESR